MSSNRFDAALVSRLADEGRIEVSEGDITRIEADAIVNAANRSLSGGGGVDGAIHRAAGPGLLAECRGLGGCPTGEARLTGGYGLPARHVIHTVGPIWRGGGAGEDALLAQCYVSSLALCWEQRLACVAFPSISTGAYRFPLERAARIAVSTVAGFLDAHEMPERVVFVTFGARSTRVYHQLLSEVEL